MLDKLKKALGRYSTGDFPPDLFTGYNRDQFEFFLKVSPRMAVINFYSLAMLSPHYKPDPLKKYKKIKFSDYNHYNYKSIPEENRKNIDDRKHVGVFIHSSTFHVKNSDFHEFTNLLKAVDEFLSGLSLLDSVFFAIGEDWSDVFWYDDSYQRTGKGFWLVITGFIETIKNLEKLSGKEIKDALELIITQVEKDVGDFLSKADSNTKMRIEQINSRAVFNRDLLRSMNKHIECSEEEEKDIVKPGIYG